MGLFVAPGVETRVDAEAVAAVLLAELLGLDAGALEETVNAFNQACGDQELDISRRDGKATTESTNQQAVTLTPHDTLVHRP